MTQYKGVNGLKVQMTAKEVEDEAYQQAIDNTPPTPEEAEAVVQRDLDRSMTLSDIDKAQFFLFADMWRSMNPSMTVAQSRVAVRARLEVHLRTIRGLS